MPSDLSPGLVAAVLRARFSREVSESSALPAQPPGSAPLGGGGTAHIRVHICTRGCCLRARRGGGVHTHGWLRTAPRPCQTLPAVLPKRPAPRGLPGALAAEGRHTPGAMETREIRAPDRSCNFTLPLGRPPSARLGTPGLIPQGCTEDGMRVAASCQQRGCQQRTGCEQPRGLVQLGTGRAEKKGCFVQPVPGRGRARVLACTCVFVLRVCSPSRLSPDMHLLPLLEQRQLPLPFAGHEMPVCVRGHPTPNPPPRTPEPLHGTPGGPELRAGGGPLGEGGLQEGSPCPLPRDEVWGGNWRPGRSPRAVGAPRPDAQPRGSAPRTAPAAGAQHRGQRPRPQSAPAPHLGTPLP